MGGLKAEEILEACESSIFWGVINRIEEMQGWMYIIA